MDGNNDQVCRKTGQWEPETKDKGLFSLYQRLAKLRKQSQALRYGGCQVVYAHDNVVVFARVYNQQRVLIAINRGEACEVVLDNSPLLKVATWKIKEGKATIQDGVLALPAVSATIWFGS